MGRNEIMHFWIRIRFRYTETKRHIMATVNKNSLEIRRDRLLQIDTERRRVAAVDQRSHRHRQATAGQPAPAAAQQTQRQRTVHGGLVGLSG